MERARYIYKSRATCSHPLLASLPTLDREGGKLPWCYRMTCIQKQYHILHTYLHTNLRENDEIHILVHYNSYLEKKFLFSEYLDHFYLSVASAMLPA